MQTNRKTKRRRVLCAVLLILLGALLLWLMVIPLGLFAWRQTLPAPRLSSTNAQLVKPDGLSSTCAILVRRADGQVLMEKQADTHIYPASLTKIMTVVLALESFPLPDWPIRVDGETIDEMTAQGASMAGYSAGEMARVEDLCYGALLPSGGECAVTLAKAVAGSEEAFAARMNEKAAELGMTQTHFVNATGLQAENHVSTVRDLAKLLDYALEDPVFEKIFTTAKYRSNPLDPWHPGGLLMKSTTFFSGCDLQLQHGEILGGKTGTTDEAGHCLASLAEVYGQSYLLVTVGAPEVGGNFADARTIYDRIPA